jgi:hypothetical protein
VTVATQNPRIKRQLAFLAVMLIVAVGILRIVEYHWRQGTALIGIALLVAAVLRLVLPAERAGLLAVRTRKIDALFYAGFSAMILYVTLTITGGPLE